MNRRRSYGMFAIASLVFIPAISPASHHDDAPDNCDCRSDSFGVLAVART
jgi:hypothetical protein